MARIVKVKVVASYAWDCPGCGEANLDDGPEREKIHSDCDMDYISVKCSNCNGSYIVDGSLGWLTRFRTMHGGNLKHLKKATVTL